MPMTPRQKHLLDFIREYTQRNDGISPSYEEMCKALNIKSKSGISRLVLALERAGYIKRIPGCARTIVVLGQRNKAFKRYDERDYLEFINSLNLREAFYNYMDNKDLQRGVL